MELNKKNPSLLLFILLLSLSGCETLMLTNWNDTKSLEEYGDKVALTMATLVTYIGKNKEDVRANFGEPTEIKHDPGSVNSHYKIEKVLFDEIWDYTYMRGIPMINAESGTKLFYFQEGIVVAVDAN